MLSVVAYVALILGTGAERITELVVSRRNAAWSFARGGVETGRAQMPWMIALHTALLLGCIAEVVLLGRPFLPALGVPMLVVALLCQAARFRLIAVLGRQWNTRIIVVPGMPRVRRAPYSWAWLPHPNYLVVAIEGIALPLVHSAWMTAVAFTLLNTMLLLGFRIPAEDRALRELTS